MNIGIVTDFYYPWIGGPSTLIRNLGHGLAARGHAVSLLAPSADGSRYREVDGGIAVTRVRSFRTPFGYNLRSAVLPGSEVATWLDTVQPDVCNVHHPFVLSASTALAARRRCIPVVATNHTIPECSLWGLRRTPVAYDLADWAFSRWLCWLLAQCSIVTTPTGTAAGKLRELGFLRSVECISNGVDIHRFVPGAPNAELRRRFGLDDRPVVLYTGRLDAEKEMDVWLRAAAVARTRQDVQFLVTGKGTDFDRLQGLCAELGLQRDVHFLGFVPEQDFAAVYRLASVYFITSPVELQSISTLEALASGLPVVAVRAGALPELVRSGVNGLLVEAGDWQRAGECLTSILQNPALRLAMARESRRIGEGHDLVRSLDSYEQVFVQAAQGGTVERAAPAKP